MRRSHNSNAHYLVVGEPGRPSDPAPPVGIQLLSWYRGQCGLLKYRFQVKWIALYTGLVYTSVHYTRSYSSHLNYVRLIPRQRCAFHTRIPLTPILLLLTTFKYVCPFISKIVIAVCTFAVSTFCLLSIIILNYMMLNITRDFFTITVSASRDSSKE